MYVILIETGGLDQLERIHRERHRQLTHDLDRLLMRHGFRASYREKDRIAYRQAVSGEIEATLIADAMRAIQEFLQVHSENLLEFLAIVGYLSPDRPADGAAVDGARELERFLPHARNGNALYMTEIARTALASVVETTQSGSLHRLVAFTSDGRIDVPSYAEALCRADERERLKELRSRGVEKHGVWIHADDRSVTTATVRAALEHDGIPPVTIQCRVGMSGAEFMRALIRELPDTPVYTAIGAESSFERSLTVLREPLGNPAGRYLSTGWVGNDLQIVACYVLSRFLQSESHRLVFIADYDLCAADAPDLLAWIPEAITVTPLVVSAAVPPPDERWDTVPCARSSCVASQDERWSEAFRYWNAYSGETGTDTARRLAKVLSLTHRTVLFMLAYTDGVLDPTVMAMYFERTETTRVEYTRIVTELRRIGLVAQLDPLRIHPAVAEMREKLVTEAERETITREVAEFFLETLYRGTLYPTVALWMCIRDHLSYPDRLRVWHRLVHALAAGGDFFALEKLEREDPEIGRAAISSARIRMLLRDSAKPDMVVEQARVVETAVDNRTGNVSDTCDYLLSLGEYQLARRNYPQALDRCKQVVLLYQGEEEKEGDAIGSRRGASHLLMARVFFLQHRLRDADRHLGFAREESGEDLVTNLTARMLEAIGIFFAGNLSRAATEFSGLVEPLAVNGFTEWLLLNWFATARTLFELGEYEKARTTFSLVSRYCAESECRGPVRSAIVWTARCELTTDPRNKHALHTLEDFHDAAEAAVFLGEAYCRNGEFSRALVVLENACTLEAEYDRRPRMSVCWDNGFASMEDLVIANQPGTSELLRIGNAYRAWALAELGRLDEAVKIFFDLTRGNGGTELDPYAGLYNYLYSSVLPKERSPDRDDSSTILGRAVKIVQERTSRIEEYHDKIRYLRSNVWNSRLMDIARAHNLV